MQLKTQNLIKDIFLSILTTLVLMIIAIYGYLAVHRLLLVNYKFDTHQIMAGLVIGHLVFSIKRK
jgi:hypothetical protein